MNTLVNIVVSGLVLFVLVKLIPFVATSIPLVVNANLNLFLWCMFFGLFIGVGVGRFILVGKQD